MPENGGGQEKEPILLCPILTGSATTAAAMAAAIDKMSYIRHLAEASIINPAQIQAVMGQPVPIQIQGIQCLKDTCGFWDPSTKKCGILSAPHLINALGGWAQEKLEQLYPQIKGGS